MNWRERLADWISGGAVTRDRRGYVDALKTINRMARDREAELRREVAAWNRREYALRAIAADPAQVAAIAAQAKGGANG